MHTGLLFWSLTKGCLGLPERGIAANVGWLTLSIHRFGNKILLKLERVAITMETRLRPEVCFQLLPPLPKGFEFYASIRWSACTYKLYGLQAVSVLEHSAKMQAQAQRERLAKLAIIDSILWGSVPSKGFLGRLRGEVMGYVTLQLIRAVTIRVEDISLTLRVEKQCDSSSESAGVGHSQSRRNSGDGSAIICISIRSFSVGSQTGKATPGVDLQMELNGLSLTVTPPTSDIHQPLPGIPFWTCLPDPGWL